MTDVQSRELIYFPPSCQDPYYRIRWRFRSDGTGEAVLEVTYDLGEKQKEDSNWESAEAPVPFTWSPERFEELTTGELENLADGLFRDAVNHQLTDPFFMEGDDSIAGQDEYTHFRCGSEQDLERLVKLVLHCYANVFYENEEEVVVRCSTEYSDESAALEIDGTSIPQPVQRLFAIALDLSTPCGSETVYNDGDISRMSGYDICPNSFDIAVPRPSAHEAFEAPRLLRAVLEKHVSARDLDELIPRV